MELQDERRGFSVDDQGTDVGIIAFGGIRGGLTIPPYEFFTLSRKIPATKVFVRDLSQCWYANGVPGLGLNLADVAEGIEGIATRLKFRPVFFGVSAGGFAALAVASMTGLGPAHVFSPLCVRMG